MNDQAAKKSQEIVLWIKISWELREFSRNWVKISRESREWVKTNSASLQTSHLVLQPTWDQNRSKPEKINSQSLEDTQVGYISQKYTLEKFLLVGACLWGFVCGYVCQVVIISVLTFHFSLFTFHLSHFTLRITSANLRITSAEVVQK